jgi:hypothetical protein
MKLRCPELFKVPRPSEKQHILEMQAQNMLEDRDGNGRRVYIFRVGRYGHVLHLQYLALVINNTKADTFPFRRIMIQQLNLTSSVNHASFFSHPKRT